MTEPHSGSAPAASYREAFQEQLKRIERRNWEDKIFYLPSEIRTWMMAKSPPGTYSNVIGLLSCVYPNGVFAKTSSDHCAGYLLVLATLLHPDVNCGNLIHIFTRCRLDDTMLSHTDIASLYESILEALETENPSLPRRYKQYNYRAVINAFDKLRWAFCPATLHLHMDTEFPGPYILPFVHGEVVNEKGGTANVRHYKIQEALVESIEMKSALESSKHDDSEFGLCYDFAVKSYVAEWKDIYNIESEAFRGVRAHPGVVKYLGEYHFREGGQTSLTHNIMLEYGQQDLDEYLADTYPPVSNTEIITFWEGIFKVAHTIKGLHQLEYQGEDGTVQIFKGWHGDIKPDNILRVREEFKLADFGFARFERDENGKSSTFIPGGTTTYGAPECDHQRVGTTTPHLQTIDTWSFGCVLSAVATWVILGSQAYDSYRRVREKEIAKLRQNIKANKGGTAPSGYDTFHDGKKVLPSVYRWHEFLRNSSRKADTISYRVLDLIEEKMLLERPRDRLGFEDLCIKLDEILLLARNENSKLVEKGKLNKIHPDILEALLQIDKTAPATATPISQVNTAQTNTSRSHREEGNETLLSSRSSQLRPTSDRVRKSERLDRIVVAKTANREQAIKKELDQSIVTNAAELMDSPEQDPVDASDRSFSPTSTGNHTDPIKNGKGVDIPEIHLTRDSPEVPRAERFTPATTNRSPPERQTLQRVRISEPPIDGSSASDFFYRTGSRASPPPQRSRDKGQETSRQSRHFKSFSEEEEEGSNNPRHALDTPVTPPHVKRLPARQGSVGTSVIHNQADSQQTEVQPNPKLPPSPPISPEAAYKRDVARPLGKQHYATTEMNRRSYEPPAIFTEHERLKKLWDSGRTMGAFSSFLGKGPREDPWLKNFISNRDIVFVVDNGFSMKSHWPDVEMTLETLAMKIGTLDKDGLDLVYTIGETNNVNEAKGWDILKKFGRSMELAGRQIDSRYETNMVETLARIFDSYSVKKRMTLIILTDGLWKASGSDDDVELLIAKFITGLTKNLKKWESRWFSFQFVTFGNDRAALKRLQDLDDNLNTKDDVIDTKPWDYPDPDKLVLGSVTDAGDKADSSSMLHSPSRSSSRSLSPASQHSGPQVERNPSVRTSRTKRGWLSNLANGRRP